MMRRLEMAIAIDRHRSFLRAARSLGISQPALTRALQTLEGEFGARLFERGRSECEPTAFGRIVLDHARRIVSEVAEARRQIKLLQGLKVGEFRIGTGPAGVAQWIGGAIGDLCAANPQLRVRSIEIPGHQQPDALMASEVDVAVGEPESLEGYPDIVVARLPRRQSVFLCRRDHPLTRLAKVELKDIAAFAFVAPRLSRRVGVHLPASSAMGAMSADGRYFEPAIDCATWGAIQAIICRSETVGVRVRAVVDSPSTRSDIVMLPFAPPWLCAEFCIMWRRDRMAHPALATFREAVRRNEALAMGGKRALRAVA
jgi:DNA-binding transcriptional LysR family regulator